MNQSLFHCANTMPWRAMPKISAPIAAPTAEPNPPVSRQPPITAAMMYWNSSPMPWFACTLAKRRMLIEPTSHAPSAVPMNSRIFVRTTGTPTERADTCDPPTAKIQLPNRVRTSSHAAIAVTTIHHTIDDWNSVPPMSNVDAKSPP